MPKIKTKRGAAKRFTTTKKGGIKRNKASVGTKLRQSIRTTVAKGSATLMKKEPSLVPDVDKKINKSARYPQWTVYSSVHHLRLPRI